MLYNQVLGVARDRMFLCDADECNRAQRLLKSHMLKQSLRALVHPQLIIRDMLLGLWLW